MAIISSRSVNGSSKSAIATRIYTEMANGNGQFTRKQVIDRFITEVGLTPAGAATYYFNISKKNKQVVGSDIVVTPTESTQENSQVATSRTRHK